MLGQFFSLNIAFDNLWVFSLIFILLNFGIILIFPKYNISKFANVPKIKIYTFINKISYVLIFIMSVFIPVKSDTFWFYAGTIIFVIGIILYMTAMFYFAISEYHLPVSKGIYKISRHPVYFSFFIIILGMIIISFSGILFFIAFLHFYTLYFIVLKEEEYCEELYGKAYKNYKQKTRMII